MRRSWDDGLSAVADALRAIRGYPGTAAVSIGLFAFGTAFLVLAVVLTWRLVIHPKDAAPRGEEMVVAKVDHPEPGVQLVDTFGRRFAYLAKRQTTLSCWVASRWDEATVEDRNGERHFVSVRRVSRGFRDCWGLTLLEGRELRPEDHQDGAEKVAIVGERLWREVFGADPSLVGDTVEIGHETVRVVGVATKLGEPDLGWTNVWRPAPDDELELGSELDSQVEAYGRPREGVTFEAVDLELSQLDADYRRENPDNLDAGLEGVVRRHDEVRLPPEQRQLLWATFIPFVGVFLLACANASGLLLIQFAGRARATALRMALGATRGALVLRFVVEGLCLALLGGAVGLVALRLLLTVLPRLDLQLSGIAVQALGGEAWDESALVVAPVVILAGTMLIALFPGLTATRLSVHEVIQDGARSVSGSRRVGRLRDAIANILVGLSYLLVVTSIALAAGLGAAFEQPLGYEAHGLVTAHVRFPACEPGKEAAREADSTKGARGEPAPEHCAPQRRFSEGLAALPFVQRYAVGTGGPLWMGSHIGEYIAVDEEQALPLHRRPISTVYEVEDGWFDVLGARLLAGRFIDEGDVGLRDCAVNASESLAAPYGGPEGVLGKTIWTGADGTRRCTVVGVVTDMNMGAEPVPSPVMTKAIYTSRRVSEPGERETYLVRVHGDAGDAVAAITDWAEATGGGTWELLRLHAVEDAVAERREGAMGVARMFGIVSSIALLFAGLGIYGIVSYTVTVRRGEHALRMALGASGTRVAREIVARQLRATLPGLVVAVVVGVVAAPIVAERLGEGRGGENLLPMAFDPLTGLGALVIIVGAVVVAALLPALRARSTDAWGALREE